MNHVQLTRVLRLMRHGDELEKVGGAISGAIKGVFREAAESGARLGAKGYKGIGTGVKYLPHAILGLGAYKAYESPTGQRVRWKLKEWKAKRQARKAGYY